METTSRPRVWVDDSHVVLRRGMVSCLAQEGFDVRGESAHLSPAPSCDDVDVLVFEADELATAIVGAAGWPPDLALVATVRLPSHHWVRMLAEVGVCAVLDRDDVSPEALAAAVRGVVAGTVTVPRGVLPLLLAGDDRRDHARTQSLVQRERDVLRLLAEGLDTRGIGGTLSYSERTVKNIVHDVLVKLDCRTRAQAVGLATREGVI